MVIEILDDKYEVVKYQGARPSACDACSLHKYSVGTCDKADAEVGQHCFDSREGFPTGHIYKQL